MNIKFAYLYRDASNYKQYNEVVFANPNELPLEQIQRIITSNFNRWKLVYRKGMGVAGYAF